MFEYLKELCERKGISIHRLEKDLGFSNGSLSKANTIPLKRAALIADYFGITIEQLWNMEYPEDTFDPVSGYPVYADAEYEPKPDIDRIRLANADVGMFHNRSVSVEVRKPDFMMTNGTPVEIQEAKRLYDLYAQAPPEIQAAVETLLKASAHDSENHHPGSHTEE